MTISVDRVRELAALARLELSESEAGRMAADLSSILAHVEALPPLEARDTGAAGTEAGRGAPLRPDRVEFDPLHAPPADFAPEWRQDFFVVPRLPALDAGVGRDSGE